MPSVAARIVDNAFLRIGYTESQLDLVNYDDKIRSYCSPEQLVAVVDFIRSDPNGGLSSIGHMIQHQFIRDVSLDSTYGLLISRVCKFAEPGGLIP